MSNRAELQEISNKRLLRAAQGEEDVWEVLNSDEFRDPDDPESFLYDINCRDVLRNTPLHLAVISGSIENVKYLIEEDGCDVDLQNSEGNTPLHLAMIRDLDPSVRRDIVHALVSEAGATASLKITNNNRQTPMDLCHIYGRHEVADELRSPSPPPMGVGAFVNNDDIASDDEDGSGSGSESE
ncbi:ankyrin repeat-containing domain protein [Phlebopus sp. FC_14]|nr:ankyrin repeat-containing domain protein [Phlebopus sp. FC_14]